MGSIFRTEGLSAGYGRKAVLSGAEITAERGRITTLIGPARTSLQGSFQYC